MRHKRYPSKYFMNRRQALKILGLGAFISPGVAALAGAGAGSIMSSPGRQGESQLEKGDMEPYAAYLMAYFKSGEQQLFYAYSEDCRNWIALNRDQPVMHSPVDLRDPYIGRAGDVFHLVHTHGWDYPEIYHYSSKDLLQWEGGPVQVVSPEKKRAWAPEWYYEEEEGVFYLFWASLYNGHNAIYYTKTKDWTDIRPENAKLYYDLGIDDIDFTVTNVPTGPRPGYYAFHKPGSLEDNFPVSGMYSSTLDPQRPGFSFGKQNKLITSLPDIVRPIEGPEIIQLNNEQKWYIYADPFHQPFIAWETTNFRDYNRIAVRPPKDSKHCSILAITKTELARLLARYPLA